MSEEKPILVGKWTVVYPKGMPPYWGVEYPDPWGHWDCCGSRERTGFDTFAEAIAFADERAKEGRLYE